MSIAPLITQTLLELKMGGPKKLAQFTDDDGDNYADALAVNDVIQSASDLAGGRLRGAWEEDEIVVLVGADTALQTYIAHIAMGCAGDRRPEMTGPDGFTMYWKHRLAAFASLEQVRDKKIRSVAEGKDAPPNRNLKPRTNSPRPAGDFTFATFPSQGILARGGF